jgi:aromatic ring-opening dioxygenase LigB subunit
LPHGDFVFDPTLVHDANGSLPLHDAAVDVGRRLVALAPDAVLLSTPHAIALSVDFAVYGNSVGAGFAAIGQDLHNASFPLRRVWLDAQPLAPELSARVVASLVKAGLTNVTRLTAFADSEPVALGWGEVIPLSFLAKARNGTAHRDPPAAAKVLVFSQPERRYNHSVAMIPELLRVGGVLHAELSAMSERVAVIISADLAHTHLASGPYGLSPAAEPFDLAVGEWARTLQSAALVLTAAKWAPKALSCGYTGLVMLQGLITASEAAGNPFAVAVVEGPYHPTYYGMLWFFAHKKNVFSFRFRKIK